MNLSAVAGVRWKRDEDATYNSRLHRWIGGNRLYRRSVFPWRCRVRSRKRIRQDHTWSSLYISFGSRYECVGYLVNTFSSNLKLVLS